MPKEDIKKQSKPSIPTAAQHFKAPDAPSVVKPELSAAEFTEAVKKPQTTVVDAPSASSYVPDDTSSVPAAPEDTEEQPDSEGKKKKSRFGLPSFMTSSGRKSKKERPTGMLQDMLLLSCSILACELCYALTGHVLLRVS